MQKKSNLFPERFIILIILILCQNTSFSKNMILDELKNPNLTIQSQEWNLVTDQVMGGLSVGKLSVEEIEGFKCYRMTGEVSTKNNGGFIQIRVKLNPEVYSKDYKGVYIKVYGNNNNYNLHLRTGLTFAPWQYYGFTFFSKKNWTEIRAPFNEFQKSNYYQPKSIIGQNIKSVGLVAGFNDFKADICLGEIGFY